ncbi:hypothetical protein LTR82_018141 [Friedmanniomyces endolithicus]|uniref:Uncharacterized protein n=1 Tax=Friedmanniomyces endolithicus TaxID=329885 RepID=A0AAN6IZ28_9PEZI|nr:hypothetical protein LTR82_018141 [Friedmanniomyces endolithicus]
MASPDLRDMLSKLCIDVRDEARFNCNKEWEIKSVVGFCHDSGEQQYRIAWQDSVLFKTELRCSLVNNKWPLYRFARQITPAGSGSQLRVAWKETWEPANAIFAAAELIHEYWLGVYQSREPLSGQLVHQHWLTLHALSDKQACVRYPPETMLRLWVEL